MHVLCILYQFITRCIRVNFSRVFIKRRCTVYSTLCKLHTTLSAHAHCTKIELNANVPIKCIRSPHGRMIIASSSRVIQTTTACFNCIIVSLFGYLTSNVLDAFDAIVHITAKMPKSPRSHCHCLTRTKWLRKF